VVTAILVPETCSTKRGGRELLTVAVFSSGSWAVRSSLSWVSARPSACTYVSCAQFSNEN
jgi:hypothetical protein